MTVQYNDLKIPQTFMVVYWNDTDRKKSIKLPSIEGM